MSHHHDAEDGFPNLEELDNHFEDRGSTYSVGQAPSVAKQDLLADRSISEEVVLIILDHDNMLTITDDRVAASSRESSNYHPRDQKILARYCCIPKDRTRSRWWCFALCHYFIAGFVKVCLPYHIIAWWTDDLTDTWLPSMASIMSLLR